MTDPRRAPVEDRALLDLLFSEDELYDEDAAMSARDLPPRAWRAGDRAVHEVMEHARHQLDLAWRQLRDRARRERLAAAIGGSFEVRAQRASRVSAALAGESEPSLASPASSAASCAPADARDASGTFA